MPGFRLCSWCGGKGCMCCDAEEMKWRKARADEYDRQFPNGPTPMFTARAGNVRDMELLKTAFHADVITRAFSPDGAGMTEIERLAADARAKQDPPVEYKPIGKGE